jgi:hypothetical protein
MSRFPGRPRPGRQESADQPPEPGGAACGSFGRFDIERAFRMLG